MNYLNFDKTALTNLEKSLTKEMIRTNRSGAYNSTTIVDCNTRKYHGQLVVPIDEIDGDNHVLLSSLDETIIQHGSEFNLGLHQYRGRQFSPNGHKYIREFSCEIISKTVYRVGGVIISKERMMVSFEPRTITKYTLIDAHSATTIRFKPFLAFRSVHALSKRNPYADTSYEEAKNGASFRLYENYPRLFLQFSKTCQYTHEPYWYEGLEYEKEKERGFDYLEDLLVPGSFEMSIKKGESIYFTAGLEPISPTKLKSLWDDEILKRNPRTDMYNCLKNAAQQFYKKQADGDYLLAGYPWFKVNARIEFISLPGLCLSTDRTELFESMAQSALSQVNALMEGLETKNIAEMDAPDALLWFVWALQQYAKRFPDRFKEKYAKAVLDMVAYYADGRHPRAVPREGGLLWTEGAEVPATWMNAVENGLPITPRTGYVVEINALWYNALCFAAEVCDLTGDAGGAERYRSLAETAKGAYIGKFWNGFYLYDYVAGLYKDVEVRPNMIFAAALPYSPLDRMQQKSVVDFCTRELLTSKGLRSLSPKSGSYRPNYVGGMQERNRNYHNGPVWPWLTAAYAEAYLRIHKQGGVSFVERIMLGMEGEMKKLSIGTLSELYDGNPPFKGHGAMSYAPTVAGTLRTLELLKNYNS